MTRQRLREAWTEIIRPDDYEAHMAAVGQAQANAELVAEYLRAQALTPGISLLFVGAGTGQMFDFVSSELLLPFKVTFADINASYLERLTARLGLRYETIVDDLEHSALAPAFDVVLAVLVLEHVDWRKAVSTMCALAVQKVFVVIQQNPPDLPSAMTPDKQVPGTMKIFTEIHPTLIPASELEAEFRRHSFAREYDSHRVVSDNKKMVALGFLRGRQLA